jgi:hypothetical protein
VVKDKMADGMELAKHDCLNGRREWHKGKNSDNKDGSEGETKG